MAIFNLAPLMKLTFLGTGTSQGVPVIGCHCAVCTSGDMRDNRLRTSVLLSARGKNTVIDTGPDFRQQMLRTKLEQLDAVLFTHEHKDHIAGLDDVRPFNFRSGKSLDIYASQAVQVALKREYHYAFSDTKYPGIPELKLHEIAAGRPFVAAGMSVMPLEVMHYQMPVMAFRIGNLAYVTDAKSISAAVKNELKGLDVLVLNALRVEAHLSHFNLSEALAMVRELSPKRAYFTHISHLMGRHADVSLGLPPGVALAYDGLEVTCT